MCRRNFAGSCIFGKIFTWHGFIACTSSRNSAVKFLFGIVDVGSLHDTFTTLLNSRNRERCSPSLKLVPFRKNRAGMPCIEVNQAFKEVVEAGLLDGCGRWHFIGRLHTIDASAGGTLSAPAIEQADKWMAQYKVPVVIEIILERVTNISMGTELDNIKRIVKLTVFVRDMANLAAYREVRNRFLATVTPPAAPAVTLIEVSKLYGPDFLIEIEAVAAI